MVNLGQHGLAGVVVSLVGSCGAVHHALTYAHSVDPIAEMTQWIHLLKVLIVQMCERDAQEILQG